MPFSELWLPPWLSFWLFLFQQSQLITPYCCRQLQTTTNLEFHYSKLFHMCFQGPGRLGWPRFRKKQPSIGTHPHPANTAMLPSFFFFSPFSAHCLLSFSFSHSPSSSLPFHFPPHVQMTQTTSLNNHVLKSNVLNWLHHPLPILNSSTAYTTFTMTLCGGYTVWLKHNTSLKISQCA